MDKAQKLTALTVAKLHLEGAEAWRFVIASGLRGKTDFDSITKLSHLVRMAREKSQLVIDSDARAFGATLLHDKVDEMNAHMRDAEAEAACLWHADGFKDIIEAVSLNEEA